MSPIRRRPGITPRPGGRRPGGRPGSGSRRPTRPPRLTGGSGFMGATDAAAKSGRFRRPSPLATKGYSGMLSKALGSAALGSRRPIRRPGANRPGGAGMDFAKMLSQLNRVPGGMSPGPMGRPTGMRPGTMSRPTGMRPGRTDTGNDPFANARKDMLLGGQQNLRGMFAEGGEVLKTPIDKLPNKGLKKLAKSPKGRKAVARMGFKNGGEAKGGKCPSRGTIRGTGRAVRGVGFKGVK